MDFELTHPADEIVPIVRHEYVLRLIYELQLLVKKSLDLECYIHSLDLTNTSSATRKELQKADSLSQRLQCIEIALAQLATSQSLNDGMHLNLVLDGVFLTDMRQRLLTGTREENDSAKEAADNAIFF